jgi:hypothetical protein
VHVVLILRIKLKLSENLRWYLQVYGLVFILGCLQKNIRLCYREKEFEDLEDFLIIKDSSCISII